MNGFAQHKIDHLSASSINLWINAPDVWVAEKLFQRRGTMSPAAKRGVAVEAAVTMALRGQPSDLAIEKAQKQFDREFLLGDERTAKEREAIHPMVMQALEALEEEGLSDLDQASDARGERIEITCDCGDWRIPIIGYLDLVFGQDGQDIDLKSTLRMPSEMSAEHQLQRAIYQFARGNRRQRFLYITPKKYAFKEDGDPAPLLADAKKHVIRLERLLRDRSAEEVRDLVHCNPRTFYWSGSEQVRHEIYGF